MLDVIGCILAHERHNDDPPPINDASEPPERDQGAQYIDPHGLG